VALVIQLMAACSVLLFALAPLGTAHAQEVVHPWQRFGAGLEDIYGWPNVMFHVSAVAITPPLVMWADEPIQGEFQRDDPLGDATGVAALVVGGLTPIVIPGALYFGGLAADHGELATAGAALIQAEVVQGVVVSALKWLTDRAGPLKKGDPEPERLGGLFRDSRHADEFNFNPFDLEWGLRWPSGHTASNFALVSTLYAFYPDEPWIALVGYPFALAVGLGMVEGDYHWLSDVVAGALIGHVIGWSIGKQFRATYEARKQGLREPPTASGWSAMQIGVLTKPLGLQVSASF
jgi:membrane-associated phospholipid phosphatase